MNDLNKVIELGKQFAEPWKKATKILSILLVVSMVALIIVACNGSNVLLQADYNQHSEISQQG